MKKTINTSLIYAIAAMAGGVFFREFTKFNGYSGVTALGKVHTHLFLLGMVVFLLAALFETRAPLREQKAYRVFWKVYNIGVPLTALMMVTRGITQVLGLTLSNGMDAAISGLSGIGHILTGLGLILFLVALRKTAKE